MLDSISIKLPLQSDNILDVGQLHTVAEGVRHGQEYGEYKLKNLTIKKSGGYLTLYGSLASYRNGNNLFTLNRNEAITTMRDIEASIGINLFESQIKRLDFAANLNVSQCVKSYYRFLGEKKFCIRFMLSKNTLMYSNSSRVLIFYDKGKHLKKYGYSINGMWDNVFRVESRWQKNYLKRLMKNNFENIPLTLNVLLSPKGFAFFIEQWEIEYNEIDKIALPALDFSKVRQPKDFVTQLALLGVQELGGKGALIELIKAENKNYPEKHNKFFPRIIEAIYSLHDNDFLVEESQQILELDELVKNIKLKSILENE